MLATLFDFPFEDRHKLPFWSDVATTSDAVGIVGTDMEWRMKHLNECVAYFTQLWRQRAAEPRKFDFISLLVIWMLMIFCLSFYRISRESHAANLAALAARDEPGTTP